MPDVTQTPEQNSNAAAAPGTTAPDASGLAALKAELEGKLTALTVERDQLAERAKLADTLAAEREKLTGELSKLQADRDSALATVDKMTKQSREAALLDKLYQSLPHAPRSDVKRLVAGLTDTERHSDNAEKTAAEIVGILKTENSALLRGPVGAGGSTNPQTLSSPQVNPLTALFGPRRRY